MVLSPLYILTISLRLDGSVTEAFRVACDFHFILRSATWKLRDQILPR